jgi:hypothetical protein
MHLLDHMIYRLGGAIESNEVPAKTRMSGPSRTHMPRALPAVLACAAILAGGCGSSAKTRSTGPSPTASTATATGPPMAAVGPVGALDQATAGGYPATNGAVLFHVRVALVRFFTSKGFSGVTAQCRGVSASVASCDLAGMNRANQSSSDAITLSIDQSTGALRITHVGS